MMNMANVYKFTNPKGDSHTRYFVTEDTGTKVEVASVTTILSTIGEDFLIKWSNWIGLKGIEYNQFIQKMANVGTIIHDTIELEDGPDAIHPYRHPILTQQPELATMVTNCYQAYLSWKTKHTVEPIIKEGQIISSKYYYGGTIDLFGKIDGKVTLLDYKSSNYLSFKYLLQLMGYANAIEEDPTLPAIEQIAILRMSKKDVSYEYVLIPYHEVSMYKELFKSMVAMFYNINAIKNDWEDLKQTYMQKE